MQCYTELIQPTGITHAVKSAFTSAHSLNLIVAKTSVLQIFALKYLNAGQDAKLTLVAEEHLAGTITSLQSVKILESKSGGEGLLIAFRDAKLTLIEWDPHQYCISTISIHYYEHDGRLNCPWSPDLKDCPSRLTVDPSSRCAALNFGIGNLAIVPFHQIGDDLVMDDFDDFEPNGINGSSTKHEKEVASHKAPYASSFVLPLTALDSHVLHPVDLAFLYEYREPTIGVLYSPIARSGNLLVDRKDVLVYAVYTLDLERKASTNLMSIQKLPTDLQKVMPLPLPVGGTLLIGSNELIHVDQGGKTTAVCVNEFAKQTSSFAMTDRADLGMRLEGCQVQEVGNASGDLLLCLASGDLAAMHFRLDGRSVSSINIQPISFPVGLAPIRSQTSCSAGLGTGILFIGSEDGDSVLIGTSRNRPALKRQASRVDIAMKQESNGIEDEALESDEEGLAEDEDDLLGDAAIDPSTNQHLESDTFTGSNIRVLDHLTCFGPVNDVAFGRKRKRDSSETKDWGHQSSLTLALASGRGNSGSVAFCSRTLSPEIVSSHSQESVDGVWTFRVKGTAKDNENEDEIHDQYIILSQPSEFGDGQSALCTISNGVLQPREGTDFDISAGATIEVGSIRNCKYTVQVLASEVRVYDSDFGLAQTWPIVEEESESKAKAVKACILDPVVLILKDDASILFLKADKMGELDELELPSALASERYISMTLYNDVEDFFNTKRFYRQKPADLSGNVLLGLLSESGKFNIFSLPNITIEVFSASGIEFLPPLLAGDVTLPKHWKQKSMLSEILLADLGNQDHTSPHLVIKNEADDLIIYSPFTLPDSIGTFKFRKVMVKIAPSSFDTGVEIDGDAKPLRRSSLRALEKIGHHSALASLGRFPMLVVKAASSAVQVHNFNTSGVRSICSYSDSSCKDGFLFVDPRGNLHVARLPADVILTQSDWSIFELPVGRDPTSIAYYQRTGCYVIATNDCHGFQLPQDDEWHTEWQQEATAFLPQVSQSKLQLIKPESQRVMSQFEFDPAERVLCIKSMSLEISEISHERKELLVIGTAVSSGENVATRGNIYLFDVADVVPEAAESEFDLQLKLICKEDVKGAVSAITAIGSQGFFLAVQGQKCMVRGLKEDLTILPVAFMDMRYYVNVASELPGTGLCILGDGFSGLWLAGYSEEPYKLQLLGRDMQDLEVQGAAFLPDGKQLYVISADTNGTIRVFQYDPENPKTERGMRLLQRSSFHTGHMPTTMSLLPRTPTAPEVPAQPRSVDNNDMDVDQPSFSHLSSDPTYQLLVTTDSGSLALLTPLPDATYRRLSALQNLALTHLDTGPSPCGLNPRSYRNVSTDGIGGLGVVDGELVKKWCMASTQIQAVMADKVGGSVWDIRADLEMVTGAGLGFL